MPIRIRHGIPLPPPTSPRQALRRLSFGDCVDLKLAHGREAHELAKGRRWETPIRVVTKRLRNGLLRVWRVG